MSSEFDEKLKELVHIFARDLHKAPNYSNTFTKKFLHTKFFPYLMRQTYYLLCADTQYEKQEFDEWFREQQDKDQEELDIYKLEPSIEIDAHTPKFTEEDVKKELNMRRNKHSRLPESSLQKIRKKWRI
jgi:hypothetical protein